MAKGNNSRRKETKKPGEKEKPARFAVVPYKNKFYVVDSVKEKVVVGPHSEERAMQASAKQLNDKLKMSAR